MEIMDSISCKDCLLIPICRHKDYSSLVFDCKLLRVCLYLDDDNLDDTHPDFKDIISSVHQILKPTGWKITSSGDMYIIPCQYCTSISSCKLKKYAELIYDCPHLSIHLYTYSISLNRRDRCPDFNKKLMEVTQIIKSTEWEAESIISSKQRIFVKTPQKG